jgi:8-oxo-dGTP pyrophosphatase MutT (NUDIX family)
VRWTVHGERSLYESEWVSLRLVDVELPEGERFEHHVVRMPRPAAGVVAHDAVRGVLLLHRHRFITDTWGWEIPAGGVSDGETPAEAAARECLEETGWVPGALAPLGAWFPSNGLVDQAFHAFVAAGASHAGDPLDRHEVERVEWRTVADVRRLIESGEIRDGLSVTALLWFLATRLS